MEFVIFSGKLCDYCPSFERRDRAENIGVTSMMPAKEQLQHHAAGVRGTRSAIAHPRASSK